MKLNTLTELLVHELQDLHSAETQLTDALPKVAKAADNPQLRRALEDHLAETKSQLERVEALLEQLEATPGKTKCVGMAGILKEGSEIVQEDGMPAVKDAALISACQRVEHYEIAGYGTARSLAETLGLRDVARVLEEILSEEKAADEKLSKIAMEINQAAEEGTASSAKRGRR